MYKIICLILMGIFPPAILASHLNSQIPSPNEKVSALYIEGMAGYNRHALNNFVSSSENNLKWNNGKGNGAFGVAVGYQFSHHFATEWGLIYTMRSKLTNNDFPDRNLTEKVIPWASYLAERVSLRFNRRLTGFFKLGLGYQYYQTSGTTVYFRDGNPSKLGMMHAAGLMFKLNYHIYIDGQWIRMTGKKDGTKKSISYPNIFLIGLGFKI